MEDPHKAPEGCNLRSVNCHVCQVALVCTCPIDPPGLPRRRIDEGFVSWEIVGAPHAMLKPAKVSFLKELQQHHLSES